MGFICFEIQNLENLMDEHRTKRIFVATIYTTPRSEYVLFNGKSKKTTSNSIVFEIKTKENKKVCISYEKIMSLRVEQKTARRIYMYQESRSGSEDAKRRHEKIIETIHLGKFKEGLKFDLFLMKKMCRPCFSTWYNFTTSNYYWQQSDNTNKNQLNLNTK